MRLTHPDPDKDDIYVPNTPDTLERARERGWEPVVDEPAPKPKRKRPAN